MSKKAVVIGSGFAGLSSACYLAKNGYEVTVLEKNTSLGGRARQLVTDQGFTFDMGPSWYWMPDVFERFYNQFGYTTSDFYTLTRLDPSYRVWWGKQDYWDISAQITDLYDFIEKIEPGSSKKLKQFLKESEYKYRAGIDRFVQLPGNSLLEYAHVEIFKAAWKLQLFDDMSSYLRKSFSNPRLLSLLEFPVLFLGALPSETPALYSLMNYADMQLGTWYPLGGMHKIVVAMHTIGTKLGVKYITSQEVVSVAINGKNVTQVRTDNQEYACDVLVGTADYHHLDTKIFPESKRMYSESYWDSRVMAPSCLLYYIGMDRRLSGIKHHNLYFDTDFGVHGQEIYKSKQWPTDPLFYLCATTQTDPSGAPEGMENLFLLIPVATGLEDTQDIKNKYFEMTADRILKVSGEDIRKGLVYRKDFAGTDFKQEYHSFKGNAYGLANTLLQTGPLKPKLRHGKLQNVFFAGQLTVPGPGVPPSIISGEVVVREICQLHKTRTSSSD